MIFIMPVFIVLPMSLQVHSHLLIGGGRRERFWAALTLGTVAALLITAFLILAALITLWLEPIMPALMLNGRHFNFKALDINLSFMPLFMIPVAFTLGLIFSGIPEEKAKEYFSKLNVTAIISIGTPTPYPKCGPYSFRVPCELEITGPDGQKTTWKPYGPFARSGDDEVHPDRWNVTGGVDIDAFTKIEILPDNGKYEKMGPKEMTIAFFNTCAQENWVEFFKFILGVTDVPPEIMTEVKKLLGGLQIISIGEPFKTSLYAGWFVPYEIRLKSGKIVKYDIAVRNDNNARRYIFDGGLP